jgi:O-antigen/teichoic acid export membrane protein
MFRLYAWDIAGRMGSQVISVAISIILARFLGRQITGGSAPA